MDRRTFLQNSLAGAAAASANAPDAMSSAKRTPRSARRIVVLSDGDVVVAEDALSPLLALSAVFLLESAGGKRRVEAEHFFKGPKNSHPVHAGGPRPVTSRCQP